jgi:hypothetical protein
VTLRIAGIRTTVCGLISLACQTTQPLAPFNASLVQTCAPWDGPAVALFLTDEPSTAAYPQPPYSGITVYRSVPEALGHRFDVGPATQDIGNAQICPAAGECQPVRAASVTFRGLAADSTVAITYRLELTSGRVITGQARARLHPLMEMCG